MILSKFLWQKKKFKLKKKTSLNHYLRKDCLCHQKGGHMADACIVQCWLALDGGGGGRGAGTMRSLSSDIELIKAL